MNRKSKEKYKKTKEYEKIVKGKDSEIERERYTLNGERHRVLSYSGSTILNATLVKPKEPSRYMKNKFLKDIKEEKSLALHRRINRRA